MNEIWVLEYRHRARKNGKWSEWQRMEPESRITLTAFSRYPEHEVFAGDKYEKRAVRFVCEDELRRYHDAISALSTGMGNPAVKADPGLEMGLVKFVLGRIKEQEQKITELEQKVEDDHYNHMEMMERMD